MMMGTEGEILLCERHLQSDCTDNLIGPYTLMVGDASIG